MTQLNQQGPRVFVGLIGTRIDRVCGMAAHRYGRNIEGVRVRYELVEGAAVLNGRGSVCLAATDSRGHAAIDVLLTAAGRVVIAAAIDGEPDGVISFVGRSESVTHAITIAGPSAI